MYQSEGTVGCTMYEQPKLRRLSHRRQDSRTQMCDVARHPRTVEALEAGGMDIDYTYLIDGTWEYKT